MKTTHGRKILQRKRQSQSQVKRDLMREKSRKETKRESGEYFYLVEGLCFESGV